MNPDPYPGGGIFGVRNELRNSSLVESVVQVSSPLFVALFRGVGGAMSPRLVGLISEVVLILTRWLQSQASGPPLDFWLSHAFVVEGVPVSWMNEEQKSQSILALVRAASRGERMFRAAVVDLGRICRREHSFDAIISYLV
mmetsp:Transcript_9310/g.19000  ORF Transcript_9310/g.19000 Transcript_9310/m.19000 type:complete len:141 (+) Transcript_9310:9799-10221(+)